MDVQYWKLQSEALINRIPEEYGNWTEHRHGVASKASDSNVEKTGTLWDALREPAMRAGSTRVQ